MLHKLSRAALGLARIALGLPWQVLLELTTAAGNVWMWALVEWDASGRSGRRWEELP